MRLQVVPAEYVLSARAVLGVTNVTVAAHSLRFGEANDITRGRRELLAEGGIESVKCHSPHSGHRVK